MDIFNVIFIIIMIIGFFIIILSLVKLNKYNNSTPLYNVDNSLKKVKDAIDQADLAIDDLNMLSEELFNQFDEKQKQLLFLYEALENKKSMSNRVDIKIDKEYINQNEKVEKPNVSNPIKNHPALPKIKELLDKGMSVPDIARSLDMGQGEIKIIMELGKEYL